MSDDYSGKLVLTPAELGFDSVAVAFGATAVGKWLEWRKAFDVQALTLVFEDMDGAGATPFTVGISTRDFNNAAFVNSETAEGMIQSVSNNPRTQYLFMPQPGIGNGVATGTTGTFIASAVSRMFMSPFLRFHITNNHGSINALVRMRAILHYN